MSEVIVVATGRANVASVCAALSRLGAEPVLTADPERVARADRVVMPGVGSFAAGMASLERAGLVPVLRERIDAGRPTLGICLGLQLMAEASEESPGVVGISAISGVVTRFPSNVRRPQLGWNRVTGALGEGEACFANGYRLTDAPPGWDASWTDHGGRFVAALQRGRVWGTQFHPELSGAWGAALLRAWLQGEAPGAGASVGGDGLRRRVVPCLDVRDGRVVKGVRFQGLRDAGDPAERAGAYARQGADELVLLDVSATPEGRDTGVATVAAVRAVLDVPLTVGGGVRSVADAARLLAAGADKVAVNSAAVARPALLTELADAFGRQCVVLALDAARREGGWEVVVRSGRDRTGLDAVRWAVEAARLGAGEVLLTSWDRDGTGDGYDTALLSAVSGAVEVPVVASGGAAGVDHLADALAAGADAVLAATIFHDGHTTVGAVQRALAARGVAVRTPPEAP